MSVVVESTTNGIWLTIGSNKVFMSTNNANELLGNIGEAMQRCGKWKLNCWKV